ncbi:hypothetical protein [Pelotomaculum propionicicum]|uniref:Uncharacterized protein n=1 Tax=Pelotomaculum propionicicum TaxID=258475 RepID=A0A4Y7RX62_9FIRM|nr:hypothetical protein [Pelotomaculum propionicicum]TEB13350.1 hypothetical protein Pmgp_00244 [Pelotomaculum propionicicum]
MGEGDVLSIRQDLSEVKKTLDGINAAVADLRVLVAGEYVKRVDCDECKKCSEERIVRLYDKLDEHRKEEAANRWKMAGIAATLTAALISLAQWLHSIFKGGGQAP